MRRCFIFLYYCLLHGIAPWYMTSECFLKFIFTVVGFISIFFQFAFSFVVFIVVVVCQSIKYEWRVVYDCLPKCQFVCFILYLLLFCLFIFLLFSLLRLLLLFLTPHFLTLLLLVICYTFPYNFVSGNIKYSLVYNFQLQTNTFC